MGLSCRNERDNTGIFQGTQPRESRVAQVLGISYPLSSKDFIYDLISRLFDTTREWANDYNEEFRGLYRLFTKNFIKKETIMGRNLEIEEVDPNVRTVFSFS